MRKSRLADERRAAARLAAIRAAFALAVFALLPVASRSIEPDTAGSTSLARFLDMPTAVAWENLLHDVKSASYDSAEPWLQQVLEYHEERVARDDPNSMTLEGLTPDEHQALHRRWADIVLARLRPMSCEPMWQLLLELSCQAFDDDLTFTAAEIAARLSPVRFREFARCAASRHPENAWIFQRMRGRWLEPAG